MASCWTPARDAETTSLTHDWVSATGQRSAQRLRLGAAAEVPAELHLSGNTSLSHRMIQKQHQQTRFVNRNENGCNRDMKDRERKGNSQSRVWLQSDPVLCPLHAQDMSGQAAHDSAQAEFAALNVSINAQHILSANLIYRTSGPGSQLPNRPLPIRGYLLNQN